MFFYYYSSSYRQPSLKHKGADMSCLIGPFNSQSGKHEIALPTKGSETELMIVSKDSTCSLCTISFLTLRRAALVPVILRMITFHGGQCCDNSKRPRYRLHSTYTTQIEQLYRASCDLQEWAHLTDPDKSVVGSITLVLGTVSRTFSTESGDSSGPPSPRS